MKESDITVHAALCGLHGMHMQTTIIDSTCGHTAVHSNTPACTVEWTIFGTVLH